MEAVGDAYVADEKDPGKLKLRFSNCKYTSIDFFDGCVGGVMTLYAIIATEHFFSNAVPSARPLGIDDTLAFQARAIHSWDSANDKA